MIVNEYPHDPNSYIQGLVVDRSSGILLEGSGLWGESSLRRVELETGKVLQYLALPGEYFGEGITAVDDRIIQLTWKSGTGFVYDRESFELLDEFTYGHEGWGITHDNDRFMVSDGTAIPYRLHIRGTSFVNLQATDLMARGHLLSDLVTIIGSIDIVLGDVDR